MRSFFRTLFILSDWLTAMLAWALFYYFRKTYVEGVQFDTNSSFYYGILIIPVLWLIFYTVQGTYSDIRRLYRLKILSLTTFATIFGSIVLFFALLLDDDVTSYKHYYQSLLALALLHFSFTLIARLVFTSIQVRRIHQRKDGFRTLLIGGSEKAVGIYREIEGLQKSGGNQFIGFVNLNGIDTLLQSEIPYLGHVDNLETVIAKNDVEEVIIALETTEHERLRSIISRINQNHLRI